jgi:hypothetical protein
MFNNIMAGTTTPGTTLIFIPSAVTSNVFLLHTGANTLNSFMTNFPSAIEDFARLPKKTRL